MEGSNRGVLKSRGVGNLFYNGGVKLRVGNLFYNGGVKQRGIEEQGSVYLFYNGGVKLRGVEEQGSWEPIL